MPDRVRARPAAYIRGACDQADLDRQREAVAEGARQRGWPPPGGECRGPR